MFNWHSQILNVQWMFMCMHMQPNNYGYQNEYAAVCMHMMCACMCKLHVLFQYVLVCIKHQWRKIVWQINQNVLLQHPCSTTHVCNFLHTLSMQHALSMQLHGQLNTTDSCKLPFRIILKLITTDIPHLPHLAIITNLMLHMF